MVNRPFASIFNKTIVVSREVTLVVEIDTSCYNETTKNNK